MLPSLFHIGPHPIDTHGFFVLLGVLAASGVFFYEAERRSMLSEQLIWIVVGTLFGGAVGARLGNAWPYAVTAPAPSLEGFLQQGGRSIISGLAGAYAGAVLTKRMVGFKQHTGDLFAPAVALGMAIGRWGCFLTEQIGTPTTLPWGISVSKAQAAHIPNCPACALGLTMHPSFVYEILFHGLMFGWLWWLRPRVRRSGELLKIYLLCYALFRFLVEFVRGNQVAWAGLTYPQLWLIPSTIALLVYFYRQWARGSHAPPQSTRSQA